MVQPTYTHVVDMLGRVYVEKYYFYLFELQKGTSSLHRKMEKDF
jgi:hypothetical protein